jgi:hypothetical protein
MKAALRADRATNYCSVGHSAPGAASRVIRWIRHCPECVRRSGWRVGERARASHRPRAIGTPLPTRFGESRRDESILELGDKERGRGRHILTRPPAVILYRSQRLDLRRTVTSTAEDERKHRRACGPQSRQRQKHGWQFSAVARSPPPLRPEPPPGSVQLQH